MPTTKPIELMLITPSETMSSNNSADTIHLVKPCETIPEKSVKKRRIMSSVVDEDEDEDEDDNDEGEDDDDGDDDDEGMQPDSTIPSHEFEKGKLVDVKALLSTDTRNFLVTTKSGITVPIASLEGNYVVVCCFRIPFQNDYPEARVCRNLEALYSQLSLKGIDHNVKLVVVAVIDTGFGEADFNSFYSTLSLDCLAIPFSDFTSRDKIWESFCMWPKSMLRQVPCLVVHPNGMILKSDSHFLNNYGAESYPFTKEHFDNIQHQDEITRQRLRSTDSPISLSELLQCDHLSLISDENSSIPTSDLGDNTVVGLYLYFDGKFMVKLKDVHQKCVGEGHNFQIVVVPIPFGTHHDPASFYNLMKESALKNSCSSWLVFPFNDKICRTLWRHYYCYSEDQLIILPHGDRPGDVWGKHIASSYEVDAFPFTRDVIIERKVSEIRSITLEQMIGHYSHMSELHNKNVLLYFDFPSLYKSNRSSLFKRLKKEYRGIKVKFPDAEVVFVPFGSVSGQIHSQVCEMKWHILPYDLSEIVMKHTYNKMLTRPSLVSIGKDGKILSLWAENNLYVSDSFASLFDNTLASEILRRLEEDTR
ncbi:putative nucleoredoxin 1-2 [Silene latifolia]|uniref:putative nucleoredoxin 1-2 n=1 Tax=Silene latifolia TaxID=37657 RepID=UPI003D786A52